MQDPVHGLTECDIKTWFMGKKKKEKKEIPTKKLLKTIVSFFVDNIMTNNNYI